MRCDGTHAVFILSRKLDGLHDNVDFDEGMMSATLHLPFSDVQRPVRYRLEQPDGTPIDPRPNNRDSLHLAGEMVKLSSGADPYTLWLRRNPRGRPRALRIG